MEIAVRYAAFRDPYVLFLIHHFYFPALWTSRGHPCLPFSPPVLAFIFIAEEGSALPLLVVFLSFFFLTHALALSAMSLYFLGTIYSYLNSDECDLIRRVGRVQQYDCHHAARVRV